LAGSEELYYIARGPWPTLLKCALRCLVTPEEHGRFAGHGFSRCMHATRATVALAPPPYAPQPRHRDLYVPHAPGAQTASLYSMEPQTPPGHVTGLCIYEESQTILPCLEYSSQSLQDETNSQVLDPAVGKISLHTPIIASALSCNPQHNTRCCDTHRRSVKTTSLLSKDTLHVLTSLVACTREKR
jgi:hypothetical protein